MTDTSFRHRETVEKVALIVCDGASSARAIGLASAFREPGLQTFADAVRWKAGQILLANAVCFLLPLLEVFVHFGLVP